jgi:alkylation response protein AidB-like acyl-CoA dehydrogenase
MAALAVVLERIASVDAGIAGLLFSQALAQAVVTSLAPESLAKSCLAGTPIIAVPMYDLPDDINTTVEARKDGDGYILQGWAPYLAAAPVAKYFIAPAKVGQNDSALFLVDKDAKGVVVQEPVVSLGLRQLPASDVGFDGTKVSGQSRLNAARFPAIADRFRAAVAALALGVCEGSYETALDYAKERYQARKMIIEHDQVRVMFSGMVQIIDIAKPLVEYACSVADSGGDLTPVLSVQTHITNAVARAATDGVQLLGGYGYMHDYGQEKRMRDAKQIQAIFGPAPVKALDILTRKLSS